MDISDTIAPNSDQLDAVDLLPGARTFSIEGVSKGNAEQPVQIHLREFPRPWRPGKSMRRVLVAVWGKDASTYAGKSLTLYCDETVRFGGQAVGGVRISHMSGIDKPRDVPLIVSRGKSAIFTVRPLADAPKTPEPTAEQVANTTDRAALQAMWKASGPEMRATIQARVAELDATNGEQP
ncbi:hypothetical protein ABRQ22_17410 [Cellulosimicrobium sp. ES-005]|uniref:Single-stranded DNA-binding protein n=1 Tax=Cellulosimicrobium sp. ES-005 TaxID=3163031 RepID=A0AAU8FYY0_9MICO